MKICETRKEKRLILMLKLRLKGAFFMFSKTRFIDFTGFL